MEMWPDSRNFLEIKSLFFRQDIQGCRQRIISEGQRVKPRINSDCAKDSLLTVEEWNLTSRLAISQSPVFSCKFFLLSADLHFKHGQQPDEPVPAVLEFSLY